MPKPLEAMAQALSLQPDLPSAGTLYLHMGRAARELGRLDEAAEHFQRAREIKPEDVEPLFDLAKRRGRLTPGNPVSYSAVLTDTERCGGGIGRYASLRG